MRQRGTSLVEILAAALILGVAVVGGLTTLKFAFNRMQSTANVIEAGLIAQGELERAKLWGYTGLPTGSVYLNASGNVSGNGTWTGAFDHTQNSGTGGWVQSATTQYTSQGFQYPSGGLPACYTVSTTITDVGTNQIMPTTLGNNVTVGYTLDNYAQRWVTVQVKSVVTGQVILTEGTLIVKGGI